MQQAAKLDADGRRKLPFFVKPIDSRLQIDRARLLQIYLDRPKEADIQATLDM